MFFLAPKWRCGRLCSFLWNSDNLGEVRFNFFSEIWKLLHSTSSDEKKSLMKTDKWIGTSRPLALRKIETPRQLLIKKEIERRTVTTKKRDCDTCEIWLKFCETQSLWRTIHHLVWQSSEIFSYKEVQFKKFCLPVRTSCPLLKTLMRPCFLWNII